MNDVELREEIRKKIALGSVPVTPEMENFMKCACGAEFEWQYVGGVGDWRNTITCEKCHRVRKGVPYRRVIIPLIALQYGINEQEALRRDELAHQNYVEAVARAAAY